MVKSLCPLHLLWGFTRIMKEAFNYALTGEESRQFCKGGQGFEVGNTEKQIQREARAEVELEFARIASSSL